MRSSIASAHGYKAPLAVSQVDRLKEAVLASRRTMCPGCPSCDALVASTAFAFRDVARYVTYFEQDNYAQSRELYQALPLRRGTRRGRTWRHCAMRVRSVSIIPRSRHAPSGTSPEHHRPTGSLNRPGLARSRG